jgi:hypothetical protein
MHFIDYFVIVYEELQKINKEFSDICSKHKNMIKENPGENPENNTEQKSGNNSEINAEEKPGNNPEINAEEKPGNNSEQKPGNNPEEKPGESFEKKEEDISENWYKKVFLKLLFIFHPDKKIKPNPDIFSTIKVAHDKKEFETIIYYFIVEKNNPFIHEMFLKISNSRKFMNYISGLLNKMNHDIHEIKSSLIWNAYFNPDIFKRHDAKIKFNQSILTYKE